MLGFAGFALGSGFEGGALGGTNAVVDIAALVARHKAQFIQVRTHAGKVEPGDVALVSHPLGLHVAPHVPGGHVVRPEVGQLVGLRLGVALGCQDGCDEGVGLVSMGWLGGGGGLQGQRSCERG